MPVTRLQQNIAMEEIREMLVVMQQQAQTNQETIQQQLHVSNEKLKEDLKEVWVKELTVVDEKIDLVQDNVKLLKYEIGKIGKALEDEREKVSSMQGRMTLLEDKIEKLQKSGLPSFINDANVTTSSLRIQPPTYDGKTPWSIYFRQFKAAAEANRWTDEDKVRALIVALRGDALNLLQVIPECQQTDYEQLTAQMEMRFGDSHLQQVYSTQLQSRYQKTDESIQEFGADIVRLIRLSYPTAPDSFFEQFAVQLFINGLRDQEIQKFVRVAGVKNIPDALACALQFEAADNASRRHGKVCAVQESTSDDIEEVVKRVLERLPRGRLRCWNCGEVGHVRARCTKKQQNGNEQLTENKMESVRRGNH